jgi:hypothetical protein
MATEYIYILNKSVPHKTLHKLAKMWSFEIAPGDPDQLLIAVADDPRAWGNAFRMIVDLNEEGYRCGEHFDWSGASG